MKKQYLLSLFMLAFCLSISSLSAQNYLILKLADGTNNGTLLSNLNRITFSSGNMIVKKTDASFDSYLISSINKMTIGIYSDVPNVPENRTSLAVYPCPATDHIQLKNAPDSELNIRIFSMDGKVLITTKIVGSQAININSLSRGLYLMKVDNDILKFVKQ